MWQQTLITACEQLNISINDRQLSHFKAYLEMLLETNKSMNLTAITDPDEAAVLHFADSLSILRYVDIPQGASLCDVGTGAGFPALPLKIMRNDIRLTMIDSLNKRLNFINGVMNELSLDGETVHLRAEEAGQKPQFRDSFDFVTARAVARLNLLIEYCVPLLKTGGIFIAMKSGDIAEEAQQSINAQKELCCEIEHIHEFSLLDGSRRSLVIIKKLSPSLPKYPRSSAKIAKKPL